jgi:hypothetical protein
LLRFLAYLYLRHAEPDAVKEALIVSRRVADIAEQKTSWLKLRMAMGESALLNARKVPLTMAKLAVMTALQYETMKAHARANKADPRPQ